MHTPLDPAVRELLHKPNPCAIATLRKDGSPVSVATWHRLVDDRIHLNLDASRVRLHLLQRDPRVNAWVQTSSTCGEVWHPADLNSDHRAVT